MVFVKRRMLLGKARKLLSVFRVWIAFFFFYFLHTTLTERSDQLRQKRFVITFSLIYLYGKHICNHQNLWVKRLKNKMKVTRSLRLEQFISLLLKFCTLLVLFYSYNFSAKLYARAIIMQVYYTLAAKFYLQHSLFCSVLFY